jgi:hypothetical protein
MDSTASLLVVVQTETSPQPSECTRLMVLVLWAAEHTATQNTYLLQLCLIAPLY